MMDKLVKTATVINQVVQGTEIITPIVNIVSRSTSTRFNNTFNSTTNLQIVSGSLRAKVQVRSSGTCSCHSKFECSSPLDFGSNRIRHDNCRRKA